MLTSLTKTESRRASKIVREITPALKKYNRVDTIRTLAKQKKGERRG